MAYKLPRQRTQAEIEDARALAKDAMVINWDAERQETYYEKHHLTPVGTIEGRKVFAVKSLSLSCINCGMTYPEGSLVTLEAGEMSGQPIPTCFRLNGRQPTPLVLDLSVVPKASSPVPCDSGEARPRKVNIINPGLPEHVARHRANVERLKPFALFSEAEEQVCPQCQLEFSTDELVFHVSFPGKKICQPCATEEDIKLSNQV